MAGGATDADTAPRPDDSKATRTLHTRVAELEKERAHLQETVRNQVAEIALHKETKDQLARQIKATQLDIEDQRRLFKASMAELSDRNRQLLGQLREAQAASTHVDTNTPMPAAQAATGAEVGTGQGECQSGDDDSAAAFAGSHGTAADTESDGSLHGDADGNAGAAQGVLLRSTSADETESLRKQLLEVTQARDLLQTRLDRHDEALQGEITDTEALREQLRLLNTRVPALQDQLKTTKVGKRKWMVGSGQ